MAKKTFKLNQGFITQKMGNKVTIFSGEHSLLFTLNDTAVLIFNGIKMGWPEDKIIQKLITKYGITEKQAQSDISEFTTQLLQHKIIS